MTRAEFVEQMTEAGDPTMFHGPTDQQVQAAQRRRVRAEPRRGRGTSMKTSTKETLTLVALIVACLVLAVLIGLASELMEPAS